MNAALAISLGEHSSREHRVGKLRVEYSLDMHPIEGKSFELQPIEDN